MQRIILLGRAGVGKTTLSQQISEINGAQVICLDSIWQPEWSNAETAHFRTLLAEAHAGERWVSDGNFAGVTFDIRLPRATQIIWLDRPKLVCSWRASVRTFKRGEQHRLRGLVKVLQFIWKFNMINRPIIEEARIKHGPDIPVLKLNSDREVEQFLNRISKVHQQS